MRAAGALACLGTPAFAATLYVWQGSPSPTPPYSNWTNAAHTIQQAVDTAWFGDTVLVTNGVYATGGRAVDGLMTNRVVIDRLVPITVQSVNGPTVTVIAGTAAPGGGNGNGAIRCVYLGRVYSGQGAVLSGFTLTNGHTLGMYGDDEWERAGGGVWNAGDWLVTNCTITGNSADYVGGGAKGGTLADCTLTANSARYGGGAYSATLTRCSLTGNSGSSGGGTCNGALTNCALTGNSAFDGGGAYAGSLNNCRLTGNLASRFGGGAYSGTLNNCVLYYNPSPNGANYYGSTLNCSCTFPLPSGTGNIADEPQLSSGSHLARNSPCIGRGSSIYAQGFDIDGQPWADPPCMGADQVASGAALSPLAVALEADYYEAAEGFEVVMRAGIEGQALGSSWDFGDGAVVSNRPYLSHFWATPGTYAVRLTAYNDAYPVGISAIITVRVVARPVYYVNMANETPSHPYTNWATAATNIQDAIEAGILPGRLVLVANGPYIAGGAAVYGLMTNRVALSHAVRVESHNGPGRTAIIGRPATGGGNGDGAIRCAYVGAGAVLAGFTLAFGHTRVTGDYDKEQTGGGVWCAAGGLVTNCILTANSAAGNGGGASWADLSNCTLTNNSAAQDGGGVYGGTLNNCTLTGNSAAGYGGGVFGSTISHCTLNRNAAAFGGGAYQGVLTGCALTANSASYGGGVFDATLFNCTLTANSATYWGGGTSSGNLNNCTLTANSSSQGGGTYYGTLNNCSLTGNSASEGGGAYYLNPASKRICEVDLSLC